MNELQHHEQNDQCLDRGELVGLRDGELTADENVQAIAHLVGCADCTADERAANRSGQEIYGLLSALNPPANVMPEPMKAFSTLQARINAENDHKVVQIVPLSVRDGKQPLQFKRRQHRYRWLTAAVAAALIALLVLPNAGVLANQFLALFRVQQFQPVRLDVSQSQQDLFKDLASFGNVQIPQTRITHLSHAAKAQVEQYTHFPLRLPTHLPAGVGNAPRFDIFDGGQATFTFDATKARAYMKQIGDDNVRIPAQLNGEVYTIKVASGVSMLYASGCQKDSASNNTCKGQKQLVVAEVPSPIVQGARPNSLNDLRRFMLSLPHLPSNVYDLWQHVDLSTGTIPLPLPSSETNAQQVTLNGASGVLLTDNSVKYGGVIWQAQGIVYVIVTNTSDRTQILDTANSLSY